MHGGVVPALEVFGRDSELTSLRGLVAADRRVGALLLTGAAGIGKTALWEAGLEMARAAGRFVLAARPAETEAGMAFAGLIDLCDPVEPQVLAGLSGASGMIRGGRGCRSGRWPAGAGCTGGWCGRR